MTFQFTHQNVRSCNDCIYVSTERHFTKNGNRCPLCKGESTINRKIDRSGPDVSDSELLSRVTAVAGVGSATFDALRDTFDGDDFVDACRAAYEDRDTSALESVDGVGA